MIDIDESTGKVVVGGSYLGDNCPIVRSAFSTVDLDTGSASPMTAERVCATGLVSNQDGSATMTIGPLINSGRFLVTAHDELIDEATGAEGDWQEMGAESPVFPVVDPVHHLLVVGFLGGADWAVNNNGMSAVGVYNLDTGKRVSLTEDITCSRRSLSRCGGPWALPSVTAESSSTRKPEPATPTDPEGRSCSSSTTELGRVAGPVLLAPPSSTTVKSPGRHPSRPCCPDRSHPHHRHHPAPPCPPFSVTTLAWCSRTCPRWAPGDEPRA